MSERLSPDRRSFKRFLSTLFQQIQRQGLRGSADDRIDPQCLPDLIQIKQEVKAGKFDLNAVINRLTKLTQRIVGASGIGVWLFTSDEVFLYAGAGTASNDERLRLEVISKLARACQLSHDSASRATNQTPIGTGYDVSDLHDTNSLLVEPVQQGQNVAGALAALSDECNGFTQRDVANLHLLADLLGQALGKAAEAGLQESVILEPATMLQLIDRIVPALERMLENDENARPSTHGFLHSEPRHEFPSAGIPTKLFQDSQVPHQEAGATQLMGGTRTGDHQEPHALWDSASSAPLQEIRVPQIGMWEALKSKFAEASTLWPVACQKWEQMVASARNYGSRTVKVLRLAGAWLLNRFNNARHQVWRSVRHSSESSSLPPKAAHRRLQRVKASISNTGSSVRNRFWVATKYRSNWTIVGLALFVQRGLRHTQDAILHAIKITTTRLSMLLQSRSSLRAPLKVAAVMAVVAIAITFLISKTGLHIPAQTTVFSPRTTTRENTPGALKSDAREVLVADHFGTSAAIQVSHRHITDRATEAALRTLSRYEIAGLRRRAEYGDDAAAFELGMAYEIGRGVSQQCTSAAQWVARAAGEGNAAAQFNLGLRYRDGDGVAADEDEAVKWLQKAAAQQNTDALGVLAVHQASGIPPSQTWH
jgi:GAF domain/Sel1 repeat